MFVLFVAWEPYSLTITTTQEPAYVTLSKSVRQAHCVYSITGAKSVANFSNTASELLLQQEPCQSELRQLALYCLTAARSTSQWHTVRASSLTNILCNLEYPA